MDFNTAKAKIINKYRRTQNGFLGFWIKLIESGYSVSELFIETGFKNVAVVLSDFVDETILLIEDLKRSYVNVRYFINDFKRPVEPFIYYGTTDIVDLREIPDGAVDFIITVSAKDSAEINKLMKNINSISIETVDLSDILTLGLDKHTRYYPYAAQLKSEGIRICLLGWAELKNFEDENLVSAPYNRPFSREQCQGNPPHFAGLYEDIAEYSGGYISQVFAEVPIIRGGATLKHTDHRSEFLNVVNGKRVTADQPESYSHTIHVFGFCLGFGYGADDKRTFSSYLQRYVNEITDRGEPWRVVTHGVWGGGLSAMEYGAIVLANIRGGEIKDGDAVIDITFSEYHHHRGQEQPKVASYIKSYLKKELNVDFLSLDHLLLETHLREKIYIDPTHVNHRGYRAVARYVFDEYVRNIIGANAPSVSDVVVDYSVLPWKWNELHKNGHSLAEFFQTFNASAALYSQRRDTAVTAAFESELKSSGVTAEHAAQAGIHFTVGMDGSSDGEGFISLNDVISLVWDKYFFYPEIARKFRSSGAYLCICFWPEITDLGLAPSADYSKAAEGFPDDAVYPKYAYFKANLYNDIPAFSKEYMKETASVKQGGHCENMDRKGKFVNVKGGVRMTAGQPGGANRRVHVFGGGVAFGMGAEDKYTLPSLLQEHLNAQAENSNTGPLKVINGGVCGDGAGERDILEGKITPMLRDGGISDGDIVIWLIGKRYSITERDKTAFSYLSGYLECHGIQAIDLTQTMRAAQGKLVYIDKKHVSHRGYKAAAVKIYIDYVKRVLDGVVPAPDRKRAAPFAGSPELTDEQNAEFREYLQYLESERADVPGDIGAIVMNCNPFTLGHRYLAERAASEAGFLYVFVVEEDKSLFPFADRFKLVSEGLSGLKNVKVLRGGKFIISTVTFPGYFSKDSAKEVAINASLDMSLFSEYIVPALDIGIRFAGSEPIDEVTKQYNRVMKETLPKYGVKFVEFERVTENGAPISASRVRALLDARDFDGIRPLVPDVTYRYLREKYKG